MHPFVRAIAISGISVGLIGCAGSGGSSSSARSGGGTAAGSTTAGTGTSGSTSTGPQGATLAITVTSPARGAMISGSQQVSITGNAQGGPNGLLAVVVNGTNVSFNSNGDFAVPTTLAFGTNIFTAKAVDKNGNSAYTSWACIWAPDYIAPADMVPDAVAGRVSAHAIAVATPIAMSALTAQGNLGNALVGKSFNLAGILTATITNVNMSAPGVTITPQQGAILASIQLATLHVDATAGGLGTVSVDATNVKIDMVLDVTLDPTTGLFVVTSPSASATFGSLSIGSSNSTINAALQVLSSGLSGLIGPQIAQVLQTQVPPIVQNELNTITASKTVTLLGIPFTFSDKPSALSIDAGGISAAADANVTAPVGPNAPAAQGSISRGSTSAPATATQHDLILSLNEAIVNRAMFTAWQSGAMQTHIDQQLLASYGINLPFALDASFLLPFFPALQALATPGQPVPIAFDVDATLPPTVAITGVPSLLTTGMGEIHVSLAMDFGQGYVPVLTVVLHAELGTTVAIQNGALKLSFGQPAQASASILANPLGLPQADVDTFLQVAVPLALQLGGSLVPPMPLPALPYGLQLNNVDIHQDGANGDFLTIEGDL